MNDSSDTGIEEIIRVGDRFRAQRNRTGHRVPLEFGAVRKRLRMGVE
jgi:hypothetical protein